MNKSLLFYLMALLMFLGSTAARAQEMYAVLSNNKLTFYYDNSKSSRTGTKYSMNKTGNAPNWYNNTSITEVEFDASFANARPTTCYGWFYGLEGLKTIKNIDYLNTEDVTEMSFMFYNCSNLNALDLSNFNTKNVTNMSAMFLSCTYLKSLDISNFNTENVTDMSVMFCDCVSLKNLDLSHFNTINVTNMERMFDFCHSLTSLDLSSFNTEKVTSMKGMFFECSSLTSLDVSMFNTSNVTNMASMFENCWNMQTLYLGQFNTSKVTSMYRMFFYCYSLTSLDLSSFNTEKVTNMESMFETCSKLETLNVNHFNTGNVTNMNNMFGWCASLTSLDVSHFNTNNVTDLRSMFSGCKNLTHLDISNFMLTSSQNTISMLNLSGLKSLTIPATANVLNSSACKNIGSVSDPCVLNYPSSFIPQKDDTGNGWYLWKNGYFKDLDKPSETKVISFADNNVKSICVSNWDTNGDGELAETEAAAVTSLNTVFKKSSISSFNELRYFTGLTSISEGAFSGSTIEQITLPDNISSLEKDAFLDCKSLISITIPAKVATIGQNALSGCTAMTSITVSKDNQYFCDIDGVLFSKDQSTLIQYPAAKGGAMNVQTDEVIPLTPNMFFSWDGWGADAQQKRPADCAYVLNESTGQPYGDPLIINYADLTLYSKLIVTATEGTPRFLFNRDVAEGQWNENEEQSHLIDNTRGGWSAKYFSQDGEDYIVDLKLMVKDKGFAHLHAIKGADWANCTVTRIDLVKQGKTQNEGLTDLNTYYVPEGTKTIARDAFYMSKLQSVTLPSSLYELGYDAFGWCRQLTEFAIPEGVAVIGDYILDACTSLRKLHIPSTVTSIGQRIANGCNAITDVHCNIQQPFGINSNNFTSTVYANSTLHVPSGTKTAYNSVNGWKEFNNITEKADIITFADLNVKAICVSNWDTDGDGELSTAEAAAVTSLGTLFKGSSITSFNELSYFVGLTSIEDDAFSDCTGLTSVAIPNSVTSIEYGTFSGCTGLISVTIPSSVTSIGYSAFQDCENLTSVHISDLTAWCNISLDYYSPPFPSNYHLYLNDEEITNLVIPSSVTSIGDGAFLGCSSLTSVTIPNGVTSIGNGTFSECSNLTSVTIPSSVTSIGNGAFQFTCGDIKFIVKDLEAWCNITFISYPEYWLGSEFPEGIPFDSWHLYSDENTPITKLIIPNGVSSIPICAFYGCKNLTSVIIPNSVTSIGDCAFSFCSSLTSVSIPNSVANIEHGTFYGCTGLTTIDIPVGVIGIGEHSFNGCTGLTSINIPNSVKEIGEYAFSYCTGLRIINISNSVTSIGSKTFLRCSGLTTISVASDNPVYDSRNNCNAIIETASNTLITGCQNTVIPQNLTRIGSYAFYDCIGLTSVTIPSSLRSIGASAFQGCKDVKFIVKDIAAWCNVELELGSDPISSPDDFSYLYSPFLSGSLYSDENTPVTDLIIPEGVTFISESAFYACKQLTSVTIPNSVTLINHNAFADCVNLESVTLGSGLTTVKPLAFVRCEKLKSVANYNSIPPSLDYNEEEDSWIFMYFFINDDVDYVFDSTSIGLLFFSNYENVTLYVPQGTKEVYQEAKGWKDFGTITEITPKEIILFADNNVKSICVSNWDTDGDGELSTAEAAAVTSLGTLFKGNPITSFNELSYFTGLTSIENEAFSGCTSLTSIGIPVSLTRIGVDAFADCEDLRIIVKDIAAWCNMQFGYHDDFHEIVDSDEFSYKDRYEDDSINRKPNSPLKSWYLYSNETTQIMNLTIPNSVSVIANYAFNGCKSLVSITIPEGVTTIGECAFRDCSNLSSISIPNSMTTVKNWAFLRCHNLKKVTITDLAAWCNIHFESDCYYSFNIEDISTLYDYCFFTFNNPLYYSEGLYYDDNTKITKVTIPNSVSAIKSYTFYGYSSLTSVIISNGVTSIKEGAFGDCSNLTSVTIPSSITLIHGSFIGCEGLKVIVKDLASWCNISFWWLADYEMVGGDNRVAPPLKSWYLYSDENTPITKLIIPNGVDSISPYTFYSCLNLSSVTIPNSVTNIGFEAFKNCSGLTSVHISSIDSWCNIVFEDSLANPLAYAHHLYVDNQEITNLDIPNSITKIGAYAFYGCLGLTSVSIPQSVKTIGCMAFDGCKDVKFIVKDIEAWCNIEFEYYIWGYYPDLIPTNPLQSGYLYSDQNTLITDLIIPEGVTSISNSAFYGYKYLSSVTIPNSVTNIGPCAFADCENLESVTLGNGVKIIRSYAFVGCKKLTSVTNYNFTPPSLDYNEEDDWISWNYYEDEDYDWTTKGLWYFSNCKKATLYVPQGTKETYQKADGWKDFGTITEIILKEIISFADNNVKSICVSNWDTDGDGELSTAEAAAVTSLETTFQKSSITSFNELRYFTGLTAISESAFSGSSIQQIALPENINILSKDAFLNCKSLTGIALPANVTTIGQNALSGCTAMTSITVSKDNQYFCDIDGVLFSKDQSTLIQYPAAKGSDYSIPEGTKTIGRDAFYMSKLEAVTLPSSLKELGYDAFGWCRQLTELTIPEGVTQIGDYILDACTSLKTLHIPSTVTSIGQRIANGCNALTDVFCDIQKPFGINGNNFTSTVYANATLHVPAGTTTAYASASGWKEFNTIISDEQQFTLSIQSSVGGNVVYNGNGIGDDTQTFSIPENGSVTITITPDKGYELKSLTINGTDVTSSVSDGKYTISGMSANTTIVVQFVKKTYTLSIQATGNGKVLYGTNTVSNSTQTYMVEYGESATLTLNPDKGFLLSSLTINGANVISLVSEGKYTISNIESNSEVIAVFERNSNIIAFADNNVKAICVANWDTDNDGELSNTEAAAVTSLGTSFKKSSITSFNELRYFTGLTTISESAFSGSTIQQIALPENINILSKDAFLDCKSLTGIALPANVTTIGQNALSGCTAMTSITVSKDNQDFCDIDGVLFSKDQSTLIQYPAAKGSDYSIPEGTKTIGRDAFYMSKLEAVTLPSSLNELGYDAFGWCRQLTDFAIPEGVAVIGDYILDTCTNLKTLYIPSTVTSIGQRIANGCNALTDVFCDIQNPFGINSNNFTSTVYANATLHVPAGSTTAYASASGWKEFNTIISDEKQFTLSIQSSAGGQVTYNDISISNDTQAFTIPENGSFILTLTPETGYELKSLTVNEEDVTASVSGGKYSVRNMTSDTYIVAVFEPVVISYTLSIQSSTGGKVIYNGTEITNTTQSFDVVEGTSVTLSIIPDNGYKMKSLIVNGNDITQSVSNNSVSLGNILSNVQVIAAFEQITGDITVDHIIYSLTSSNTCKLKELTDNTVEHISIPEKVEINGMTWMVTELADNAFSGKSNILTVYVPSTVRTCGYNVFGGCSRLSAIIWQPQLNLSNSQCGKIENPNLLFYTSSEEYAPSSIVNVVVNNHVSRIILIENNEFYCPIAFTADRASLTHNYTMQTGIGKGKGQGWETIVLPFDVKTITHVSKGTIVPFKAYTAEEGTHPFWLYEYDSTRGFVEADAIKANLPYILSLPNNSRYAEEYILAGKVEFSSENVTVRPSDELKSVTCGDNIFIPTFQRTPRTVKALNVNNDFVSNSSGQTPGSRFIYSLREVLPFEAYMISASGAQTDVGIFDELPTSIGIIPEHGASPRQLIVYSTSGQVIKVIDECPEEVALRGLAPGVYIVNGKKKVVK